MIYFMFQIHDYIDDLCKFSMIWKIPKDWFTWILVPWASQRPKSEQSKTSKNIRMLLSFQKCDRTKWGSLMSLSMHCLFFPIWFDDSLKELGLWNIYPFSLYSLEGQCCCGLVIVSLKINSLGSIANLGHYWPSNLYTTVTYISNT